MTTIKLINLHDKQKEIVKSCLDPNILFIVAIIGRRFGKTTMAENLAIYWATNNRNVKVYWVSPTDSQSNKIYKEIVNAIYESGCIKSNKETKGDTEISFHNGSKILFRSAASEDSLRGEGVNYMILDEAAFIKESTFNLVLKPMLAVGGRKCLFISTPKGKNYLYKFFLMENDNPKWKSFRFSSKDSPLVSKEFIEEEKRLLPSIIFQQEYEAEFVDKSSIFNNISDLMTLEPINSPIEGEKYYAGIDIGLINDASVISIIDSSGYLVKYYRWENIEAPDLIKNIIDINNLWGFKSVFIEDNNQGLPIYQDLKYKMNNIEQFNTNTKTKVEMINDLIYAFNTKSLMMVKDDYLRIELEAFIFTQNDNGRMKFSADSGFHDDCVMSLAVAYQCYKTNGLVYGDTNSYYKIY